MSTRSLALALAILALATTACLPAQSYPQRGGDLPDRFKLADGTEMYCHLEKPTGSNIPERVCDRLQGGSLARKQANSELLDKPVLQGVKTDH